MFYNVRQCLIVIGITNTLIYLYVYFQVAEVKEELKTIYSCEEAEASTIYNLLMTNLELYNQKLKTLEKTRDLIEQVTPVDEFNEWDCLYVTHKELKLDVVDQRVSIIHFF